MLQNLEKELIREKGIEKNLKYPLLEINLSKIYDNAKYTVNLCNSLGISVAGVVKGFNALPKVVDQFISAGCEYIAHSRMDQIIKLKQQQLNKPIMLIRIPMLSEIEDLVNNVDISLNSEMETLQRIQQQCQVQSKTHKVILMIDLGDLREGLVDEKEILDLALYVENELKNVELYGIGTNLGCYGSIKPTETNLGKLCSIAEAIEEQIKRKLDIISGGATSSLTLIMDGKMPKKVNNLRLGEGILNARDLEDFWEYDMSKFHKDSFILKAEIVEIKQKPSHPVGEIFIDAFGNKPTYEDRGIRRRALLAVGKQDFAFHHSLLPKTKGIEVIGSSSDHLIIDIEDCSENLKVGDVLSFDIYYPNMLYLSGSTGINKVYVN
ncbi:alanine/ornithine racemase family PLP-dependent enzyme [Clostridium sp.]|uniref:alanine/ornithine racemase family PLP-dependent enzyme n=1 Tax=Clostridium sp. TaxID=1506 RepID=UPI002FCBCA19